MALNRTKLHFLQLRRLAQLGGYVFVPAESWRHDGRGWVGQDP